MKIATPMIFNIQHQLESAERLDVLMRVYGFAIWQLQELENLATMYLVIRVKSQKGMGIERGNQVLEKSRGQTFGASVRALKLAGVLDAGLADDLTSVLKDRNWLVHQSRRDHRGVVFSKEPTDALLSRIKEITEHAEALIKRISYESKLYVAEQGIDMAEAEKVAHKIAQAWGLPI